MIRRRDKLIGTLMRAALVGVILVMLYALIGCSTARPYAEVGLAYQMEGQTDYWVQQERTWQCSQGPMVEIELGLEIEGNWQIGYHHQSWIMCGKPLGNGKPEVYQDDIRITKKWGGQ